MKDKVNLPTNINCEDKLLLCCNSKKDGSNNKLNVRWGNRVIGNRFTGIRVQHIR